MNSKKTLNKKIILIGSFGVGKTSLTRRFVHQKFSDEYLTTLGVKIDKKEMSIDEQTNMNLLIWDIAGEVSQEKVNKSYYLGSHGIIYVFDLTRPSTYENMEKDLQYVAEFLPNAPVIRIGNKLDMVPENQLRHIGAKYDFLSSAKTGESVEEMFITLAKKMV
jgi:small GTP-binding protein